MFFKLSCQSIAAADGTWRVGGADSCALVDASTNACAHAHKQPLAVYKNFVGVAMAAVRIPRCVKIQTWKKSEQNKCLCRNVLITSR